MMQKQSPKICFTIEIDKYEDNNFIGFISGGEYKGTGVQASSLEQVFNELAISIRAIESYKKYKGL